MKEVQRDRNTVECERFAEQNGFTGAVGGHFPGLAFPPPPTFVPALPPSALRLSKLGRPPRRVADRIELFLQPRSEDDG